MSKTPYILPSDPNMLARQLTGGNMMPRSTSLPNPIPGLIVLGSIAGAAYLVYLNPNSPLSWLLGAGVFVGGSLIASAIKVAAQWERAILFRFGRFVSTKGPGIFTIIPLVDAVTMVDTRIQTLDIPRRQAITKDNVPVSLDGVIFLRVNDPGAAVTRVANYTHAVQQYAQTALRDIVGGMTLDEILADREKVGEAIQHMVSTEIDGWGLDVASIRIQDIELPEDLKRVMARQASAEREKRANITKSEGDREAAENLSAAARLMNSSPGALQLRTLQTLDGLGNSSSNTVVIALPMELVEALGSVQSIAEAIGKKALPKPTNPE